MFTPVCVTPPEGPLVPLEDLAAHCTDAPEEDYPLLVALEQAAVGHIDGWKGILGRCVQAQTWKISATHWGCLRLPFPDVTAVKVHYLGHDGDEVDFSDFVLSADPLGGIVTARGPATTRVDVEFTCELPAAQLAVVRLAVKMLVGHWYRNREAVSDLSLMEMPYAVSALLNPLRWMRI